MDFTSLSKCRSDKLSLCISDACAIIECIENSVSYNAMQRNVSFAQGYIRALCDQQLINLDCWYLLANEIDYSLKTWLTKNKT